MDSTIIIDFKNHRSRERIKSMGEVFTPNQYVQQMLNTWIQEYGGLVRYLIILLMLSACAQISKFANVYTPSFIIKTGLLFSNRMEGTPIVWNNSLMYIISNRTTGNSVEFYTGSTLIGSVNTSNHLISAIVYNNTLYIFGSNGSTIEMISSPDLTTWTTPQVLIGAAPGQSFFNSSVAVDNTGFIMAYETCEANTVCFNARFMHSTNLINWTPVGTIFKPQEYAACPTIRFYNGYYYMFYLRSVGHFATFVTRSSDLVTWEDDRIALSSLGANEGINNSDMDFVELNGKVYIEYASGNQSSNSDAWANINGAIFNGTQNQFLERFFQ